MFNNSRAQQQVDPNEGSFDEEYSGSEGEEGEEEETFPETDQTLEYQESILTPDIYEHPIFCFKEDALLGPLSEVIKSLLVPFPDSSNFQSKLDMFKAFLFTSILGNKQISQLKKEFKKLGLESKTSCGNMISLDEISFRCLDCEIISSGAALTSLFCSRCFDNSNHNGHRVIVVKLLDDNTGYCDCGDSDMVKPEGFCPDHKRIEVNREAELKKFPSVLVNTCQSILCKAFYGLAACFEIAEKLERGNSYQALVSFGQKFSDEVLGFIENGYTGISNSFLLVLNTVLESNFQAPYNQVWHNCDCLKHEVNNSEPKTSHSCKCSILSILLRYCVFIDKGDQSKIKKVLTECMKELQFKNFVGVELIKNLQFLFPLAHLTHHTYIRKNPSLATVSIILSSTEDLVIKMIRSEDFKNVIQVIKNTINNYSEVSERMLAAANLFEDLTVWFSNPEFKVSTRILISETSIVTEILDILLTLQMKFLYLGGTGLQLFDHQVGYRTMSNTLRVQKRVSKWIENILKFISTRPQNEKDAFFKVFAKEWYDRYQTARAGAEIGLCLTPVFERLLCYTLRSHEYQISQESIVRFFTEYLPEVKVEELAASVIAGILKCFGFIRYLGAVVDTEMEKLFDGYYIFGCIFYEVDVVTVQKMIMIADPKSILEVIGDSFFSYDQGLKGTWKDLIGGSFNPQDEHLKKKMTIMKDFLTYLVYLMNDELCLLNMNTRAASVAQRENDPNNLRIVQKAALNVLLSEYWTEYGFLKENMANSILLDDSVISKVIPKISEHNEKEQKIRIKDELVMELDPYIFYKTPLLQADIINHAASRIEKNPDIDVVGGKSYTDLQEHLGVIKEKLFQSNLPKFLNQLVISSSNKAELASLIPTALKLILLNLQCCSDENYLSPEFSIKLAELQKREDLKECKLCIQKIQNVIKKLKGGEEDDKNLSKNSESIVDEAESKKKAAQEKMNKLKEEFAKKQALFADKNKEIIGEEDGSPEVQKEVALTCPYCLAPIDEKNDTYGMPIFITYTNNYYSLPGMVLETYADLKSANWMPVLSSCYHSYHKKCFNEAFKNVRDSPEIEYLKNPVESYCSICKTLCNHFLIINESAEKEEPENSEEPVSPMFSYGVCHKMKNLLNDQRLRIIMRKGEVVALESGEILRRMFKYFINMSLMNKKSHELQKLFELYLNFFKSLKRVDKTELGIGEFIDDPFSLLVIQRMIGEGIVSDESADTAFANFLKMAPEFLLDDKLAAITLQSLAGGEKQEEYLRIQFRNLREYLEIRMLQYYIAVEGSKLTDLKGCASYYRNNLNILNDLLLKTLGFHLSKFAFAIYLNNCLLSDHLSNNTHAICHLLAHPTARESMDNLFNLAQIPYTVESLLNECLENIEKGAESEYLLLNNSVKNHLKAIEGVSMATPPTLRAQAVQLPSTFAGFNNTLYRRKCAVCRKYDGAKNMSFCLICGIVMCEGPCYKPKSKNAMGNFNIHACQYHMGTAAYYHLFEPVISYVVSPFNVVTVTKSLYSDTFGQSVEEALDEDEKGILKLDFKDFVLNSKFVEELHHMIKHQELEKEYFKTMINLDEDQEIPQDGFL